MRKVSNKEWIEDFQNVQTALYANCLYNPDRVREMVDELQAIIHRLEDKNYQLTDEEETKLYKYRDIAQKHFIKNARYWS